MKRSRKMTEDSPASCLPRNRLPRREAIILLALAPFAFGALALLLGQDMNWDLRNYHWYNAYAFMTGRTAAGTDLMTSQIQFFFNPLLDVPFYLLGTHLPARAAFFILGTAQGLNFILIFMLAHLSLTVSEGRRKNFVCAGLAALGMLGAMGIAETGTVFNDNLTSLGLLLSALLVLRWRGVLETEKPARALLLAAAFGIPAGLMAGLKMTCLPLCAGLFFAMPAAVGGRRPCGLAFGAGLAAGFLITYGYWGYHLFSHYGSPAFPFFNSAFRAPLFPPVSIRDDSFVLRNAHPLMLPFFFARDSLLVADVPWRDWRIPVLYALAPAALLWRLLARKKPAGIADPRAAAYLLCAAAVAYFAWMVAFCIYRYLLPIDMLTPVMIVLCCGLLPVERKTQAALAAALLAVIALSVRPGDWGRLPAWREHVFNITHPALPRAEDLMILMTGADADAYIAASFPPEIPFVRIESRTSGALKDWQGTGLNELVRDRINGHRGRLMALMPQGTRASSEKQLRLFGLGLSRGPCGGITDLLRPPDFSPGDFPATYDLCDVRRVKPSTTRP